MNYVIKNNKEYILIGFWDIGGIDSRGNKYVLPKEGEKWNNLKTFVEKLKSINSYLIFLNKFTKYEKNKKCLICGESNISTGKFKYNKFVWEDGLVHYIEKHNFHPNELFLDLIYLFKFDKTIKLNVKQIDNKFIKININQLMILDSLMRHGGYVKKYIDLKNKNLFRYSEHYGILEFNSNNSLNKIIVSGNTTRVDNGDNEIFLPKDITGYLNYEYIFHTHPPTPRPGGRASEGILYEVPSIGDILHFIDSFNNGKICGSIVITSEGLYNIRKTIMNHDKINIDEDKLFIDYRKVFNIQQKNSIEKYGTSFTSDKFYRKIAKDTTLIDNFNQVLNKSMIKIDYYPRIRNKNTWILNQIYLPIF